MGDVRHSTELGEDIRDGGSREVGPIDHPIGQVPRGALLGLQRVFVAASRGTMRGAVHIQSADRTNARDVDVERLGADDGVERDREDQLNPARVLDQDALSDEHRGEARLSAEASLVTPPRP